MTRLAELQAHLASMGELSDIVGAMRSLAGMRILEAQRAVPSVRRYAEAMASAIGAALRAVPAGGAAPPPPGRGAVVLFAAEHGFVAGFNERLVAAARDAARAGELVLVVGTRGGAVALEHGLVVSAAFPVATRPASAPETARRIAADLYARLARSEIARVEMVFARVEPGEPERIVRQALLPLDRGTLTPLDRGSPPLSNLAPAVLLEQLVAAYVVALLTHATVETIASENAARFAAMEAAHANVSRKLDRLRRDAGQARQDEITTELIDLVTGAEAMQPGSGG